MEALPNPEQRKNQLREYFNVAEGVQQKFIVAEDKETNEKYIYTSRDDLHMHLVNKLLEKGEKFFAHGGGSVVFDDGIYYFSGKSAQLGEFKKEDIESIREKLFTEKTFEFKE